MPYRLPEDSRRYAIVLRISYNLLLVLSGVVSGFVINDITHNLEVQNGERNYEVDVSTALAQAEQLTRQKQGGAQVLSALYSSRFPDPDQWPFVALKDFDRSIGKLASLSQSKYLSFHPIVRPEQAEQFAEFAFETYVNEGLSDVVPNHTEGFGIWRYASFENRTLTRVPQNDAFTEYNSKFNFMVPLFQSLTPFADPFFMIDNHADAFVGSIIEGIVECSNRTVLADEQCGAMTELFTTTDTGYDMFYLEPIFAANQPESVVGFISLNFGWVTVFQNIVPSSVNGLDLVLSSSTGENAGTYRIENGVPKKFAVGDLHDRDYDKYGRSIVLNGFGSAFSYVYTLTVYPTGEYFEKYETNTPQAVTIGLCMVFVLCGILFLCYDFFMRGESRERKIVLDMKRRFVRYIAHEIRTPFNTVLMGITLLRSEIANAISSNQASYLNAQESEKLQTSLDDWLMLANDIEQNTDSAITILNDLLNYDKVETGKLQLEITRVDISNLIQETVRAFNLQAEAKKVALDLVFEQDGDIEERGNDGSWWKGLLVLGDDQRLRQVIRNLVSNALKFTTNKEGRICVTARHKRDGLPESVNSQIAGEVTDSMRRAGSVYLSVKDNGAGMTRDQVSQLFQEGVQFDVNRLQSGGGSGLGLYITKGLVERHSGKIHCESEGPNLGTTMVVELPLFLSGGSMRKRSETPTTATATTIVSEHNILVVDDVPLNRSLLVRILETSGHTCQCASNGQECIDLVAQSSTPFDTILMDSVMPVMDGPTATEELRRQGYRGLIVGVTGNLLTEDVNLFKLRGADEVIGKPFRLERLVSVWSARNSTV